MFKLLIFLVPLLPFYTIGQTLSGNISNTKKQAIEGAYIFNTSSNQHAHSDHNGRFTIENVSKGDTLMVTHIGFESTIHFVESLSEEISIRMEEKTIDLDEIVVSPDLDAINILTEINIKTNPVNSSQEILRKVPGLVIGQHAGGGKAEQIFLRGFDIDHGTDINITVDGVPVNMVSHAHGQGYADLHFLIPETIESLNFGKGPYYTDQGNFTTAGYVAFNTFDRLSQNKIKVEAGQFNTQRILGMFDLLSEEGHGIYTAAEYISNDGPFESPQNFDRLNIMAKYSGLLKNNGRVSLSTSWFTSKWDASGQIPVRAIQNGVSVGLELLTIPKEDRQVEPILC